MIRRMSAKADAIQQPKNTRQSASMIRAEFPLLIGSQQSRIPFLQRSPEWVVGQTE
jgi:hypothetical protein